MTNLDDLQNEILEQVRVYTDEVKEKIEKASKETAQKLMMDLKKGDKPYKEITGNYNKGWRVKKVGKKYVVHNKTDYQLTHLLEHGHAKIGGGRVGAKIHIAPAEEIAVRDFMDKVEDAIKP